MGNEQCAKQFQSYEIANENLDKRNRERTVEGPQRDLSSLVHDSYFTSLMTPTVEDRRRFWGPMVEDIDIEPILNSSWTVPRNINLNVSTESLQWSTPPSLNSEKSFTSAIPSTEADSRNRMADCPIIKDATFKWPPALELSTGRFRNHSTLYPMEMNFVNTHLAKRPITCSDGSSVSYQEQLEIVETTWASPTENQMLKAADTSATNQGSFLAHSRSPALEALTKVPQPPNYIIPLDTSQTTEQTDLPLFAFISSVLKNTRGHSGTEPSITTLGLQDGEAEKITRQAAEAHCMTKTSPTEDSSIRIPQPSLCTVQAKADEETQVKSMGFSYADALKRSPKISQERDKNDKLVRYQSTTHKATTKAASLSIQRQNRARVISKNAATESKKIQKSWNQTESSPPPFNLTKAQLRFQWIPPQHNPKDHFQFKSSWTMDKAQGFTSRNTLSSRPTWTVSKNTSIMKAQEHVNPDKKDKVYQSYPIARRSHRKLVCNMSATCKPKEPVRSEAVGSAQPKDTSSQTQESTLLKKPQEESNTSVVTCEKSDRIIKSSAPEELPEVKPAAPQLMPMSDVTEQSAEEHGNALNLGNSCPPVPQEMAECPDIKHQIPDPSLVVPETKSASDLTTGVKIRDNTIIVENDPDEAPKHQPSRRWKDFYVDNHCTMKCSCRHRPGKLPPNVVRWFSVSQNSRNGSPL
ncbi:uncharacterized protein ACNLHF_000274 isoform 1-T2 [Anomaloglossus baeobatrachus]|uniref:uncharacterized protein LOC142251031 n=1 Tax=Anomaloglossus baeobatrachus TaxID=238106 RepID=UPI003F50207C